MVDVADRVVKTLYDMEDRNARLREALYLIHTAAVNGGVAMERKQRGGREKLAYIERTAREALYR